MKIETPTKSKQLKLLPETYVQLIKVHDNTLPIRTIQALANDALKFGLNEMAKRDTTKLFNK